MIDVSGRWNKLCCLLRRSRCPFTPRYAKTYKRSIIICNVIYYKQTPAAAILAVFSWSKMRNKNTWENKKRNTRCSHQTISTEILSCWRVRSHCSPKCPGHCPLGHRAIYRYFSLLEGPGVLYDWVPLDAAYLLSRSRG